MALRSITQRRRGVPKLIVRSHLNTAARELMLSKACHPWVLAFLFADLFHGQGWLEVPLCTNQLARRRVRLLLAVGACVYARGAQAPAPDLPSLSLRDAVRHLPLHQSAQGCEIRNLAGVPRRGCPWNEVPADWFHWSSVISVPWREQSSHINVCETRARDLALRARARQVNLHRQRFLHLMDSQVNLAAASKGRSASRKLAHVLRRSAAVLLACGLRDVNAFVTS